MAVSNYYLAKWHFLFSGRIRTTPEEILSLWAAVMSPEGNSYIFLCSCIMCICCQILNMHHILSLASNRCMHVWYIKVLQIMLHLFYLRILHHILHLGHPHFWTQIALLHEVIWLFLMSNIYICGRKNNALSNVKLSQCSIEASLRFN